MYKDGHYIIKKHNHKYIYYTRITIRVIPVKFTWEGRNAEDFLYYRWRLTDSFYSGGWGW